MCCTPPLLPAGTDKCHLRDTSVPRKVLYCLQGQINVISGIHLPPKRVLYTSPATCGDRQLSSQGYICPQNGVVHLPCYLRGQINVISGIHLSPKRCCTHRLPSAGADSCLLRDTSVRTEVLNTTCRDRQLSSLGYICPQKGNVHLPCHLLGQTAVFPGTRLTRQSVGKLVGTMSC